jgi:uncharacterized protein (TIGR03000 family)
MMASSPATLVVNLPANATLAVDGKVTTSTSARRVFVTPDLETSSQYVYNLTATVDGQVQTQAVTVQGGRTTEVNFNFAAAVASR